jgi:protein O-GlcNAc transferase
MLTRPLITQAPVLPPSGGESEGGTAVAWRGGFPRSPLLLLTLLLALTLLWRPAAGLIANSLGAQPLNAALLAPALTDTERRRAFETAGTHFARGTALAPRNGALLYNLAAIYDAVGDRAAATRALQAAVTRDPDHDLAQFALGQHLAAQGELDAAMDAWRAADAASYFAAQGLDLKGEAPADALQLCDRAAALDPALAEAHLCRAKVLADLERWAEALDAYTRAGVLAPRDPEPSYRAGLVIERHSDRPDDAAAYYRDALARDAAYHPAVKALVAFLAGRGRCEEAQAVAAQGWSTTWKPKQRAQLRLQVGGCFLERDDPAAAREHLSQAVALNPEAAKAWWLLAQADFALARDAEAAEACRRVLALKPDHAGARELLDALQGAPGG